MRILRRSRAVARQYGRKHDIPREHLQSGVGQGFKLKICPVAVPRAVGRSVLKISAVGARSGIPAAGLGSRVHGEEQGRLMLQDVCDCWSATTEYCTL